MGFQYPVQFVQNNSGTDNAASVFDVQFQDAVEVLRVVQHQRFVHRLTTLGRSATTGQDGDTLF